MATKRKLVKLGTNTLMVSLPAKWVRKNSLKKGDELFVKDNMNQLILTSEKQTTLNQATVKYDSGQTPSKRLFLLPYIRGYDRIKICYENPDIVDFVEKNMYILTGFEIVEQKKDCMILSAIAKVDDANFDQVLERLFNIILSMLKELQESFMTDNFDNLGSISKYEGMANKLNFFCRRILNKTGYSKRELTTSVYCIVQYLEHISDVIRDALHHTAKKAFSKDKEVANALGILVDLIKANHAMFHKKDITLLKDIKQLETDYQKTLQKEDNQHLAQYLRSLFYPVHHISEEVVH